MAYVGLRKPIIGKLDETGKSYNDPFFLGKAVGITITPNYAEGSLYADDIQAEYDKEFNYAEVSLNTSTIPIKAHKEMFGHEVTEDEKLVSYKADDQADYVGMGWISVEKVDRKRSFVGNFLNKVKFAEPTDDYATKGENIEYKTPSISGRALAMDDGIWKETKVFETEKEALEWVVKTKFGAKESELLPQA